jgi:hypothetical protein
MNPLQPTKVYVPVSVDDEVPEKDGPVYTITPNLPSSLGEWFTKEKGFNYNAECAPTTHWLKEQSLYCLTKEELEAAFKECIELAREEHIPANRWHPKQLYSESEIIKQLLP